MRIAIVDPRIQAPGLVKLFPEADYYVISHNGRYDLDKSPDRFHTLYRFRYREDLENITDRNYDVLFIVYACFDFRDTSRADVQHHLGKLIEIVGRNGRCKIIGFSNDDSAFDPAIDCGCLNAAVWFKRNYQSVVPYSANVHPFPFIMFGHVCPLWRVLTEVHSSPEKIDRVLWAGYIGRKNSPVGNRDYLSRHELINSQMRQYITMASMPNEVYMHEVSRSLFALDMNGEGDPNYRTFELLTADALILQQFKYLVWPFDEGDAFCDETIYKTPGEFVEKLGRLRADRALYDRCLKQQKHLKARYFTTEWLRRYIKDAL
jgi:hypothetical protein